MADYTKRPVADMSADPADAGMGTSSSPNEVDWDAEDLFWGENYHARPYAHADRAYEYYRPAYRYGCEASFTHQGRGWNDAEPELARGWEQARGPSKASWDDVKLAVRDAWERARQT